MTTATATKAPAKNDNGTTEIKVSEAVKNLAGVFEKSMKVDKDGTVTIDGDLIADNLPPELSMADIKRVQKHRGEVVAAAVLALGNKALPVMGKNKDLEKVSTSFKLGSDKIDLAIDREKQFNDGKGGKLTKHGYVSVGYTASGATNAGEFKKVRQIIADEAATLFG